jgi:hypothetical protein
MAKVRTTLYIEKNLIAEAKEKGINLSNFTEQQLSQMSDNQTGLGTSVYQNACRLIDKKVCYKCQKDLEGHNARLCESGFLYCLDCFDIQKHVITWKPERKQHSDFMVTIKNDMIL